MKIQNLAIIFVVIIVPISLALSMYVNANVDTIAMQNSYDTKLYNAVHDAIKAFQLNTTSNNYSSVSDSKIRDIEASINTFFNSLGTSLGYGESNKYSLEPYIPALVYTLYDGYYIYTPYKNTYNGIIAPGLKPYIYYSARYVKGNDTDFVVNYTLDNLIVIYGMINGKYVTKAGYLINPDKLEGSEFSPDHTTITGKVVYKGIEIDNEYLEETIITNDGGEFKKGTYRYININGNKIYYDPNGYTSTYQDYRGNTITTTYNFFRVVADEKNWMTEDSISTSYGISKDDLQKLANGELSDHSAKDYYKGAYEFTTWVNNNLNGINKDHMKEIELEGYKNTNIEDFNNTGTDPIFECSSRNDPEEEGSTFNEHRRAVIKNSIQSNLNVAISNYNDNSEAMGSTYNYALPVLSEVEWDKVISNVCVVAFMQGVPLQTKMYNSYTIVANNINKEYVTGDSLYFVHKSNGVKTYHQLGCDNLNEQLKEDNNLTGFLNINFMRQSIVNDEEDVNYFYPADSTADYNCVVYDYGKKLLEDVLEEDGYDIQKKAYYTALGREKYNAYKLNSYLNLYEITAEGQ